MNDKDRVMAMYGANKKVSGEYDKKLAVKCNNGTFIGKQKNGIASYKGIPYAQPPIGSLRWKPPVDIADSNDVYEAFYYGNSGIQIEWPTERASYYKQSEDCLTLNVWTNKNDGLEKKPVMVYIHGGSYGWGGTTEPLYDCQKFAENHNDVVYVNINYRIGILGFIDFTAVEGGDKYRESGNLGLLDQVCALKWIKKNIAAFGGDCDNVTIFGESAGGGSVSLLPLIEGTKGLFKRIIAQSGSLALTFTKDQCQNAVQMLLKETDSSNMDDLLSLTEDEIINANNRFTEYGNFPELDGVILPNSLKELYEKTLDPNIDFMTGSTSDEMRYWIGELEGFDNYKEMMLSMFDELKLSLQPEEVNQVEEFVSMLDDELLWNITELYNDISFRVPAVEQASRHSDNGGKSYMYYWNYPSSYENYGACHAVEVSHVFGNLNETIVTGDNINPELSKTVQEMWVNFAKTGDPSTSEFQWETYNTESRETMILGNAIYMESKFKQRQNELVKPLLKYNLVSNM